jgi:hypothetical protein
VGIHLGQRRVLQIRCRSHYICIQISAWISPIIGFRVSGRAGQIVFIAEKVVAGNDGPLK